jgi:hypothetical protein
MVFLNNSLQDKENRVKTGYNYSNNKITLSANCLNFPVQVI